jgi:hypothetical protein
MAGSCPVKTKLGGDFLLFVAARLSLDSPARKRESSGAPRQMIPSGAYLDRDCFVAVLLAMTSTYDVIASEAKQSRRRAAREQASGLHH